MNRNAVLHHSPGYHFSVPWDLEHQNRPYPERVLQKRMEYPKTLRLLISCGVYNPYRVVFIDLSSLPGFRLRSTQGCVVGRFQRQLLRLPRPCPAKNVAHGQSAVGGGSNKMFPRLQSANRRILWSRYRLFVQSLFSYFVNCAIYTPE